MHRPALKSIVNACGRPSAFAALLAGGLALSALIGTGCEGTSSGVDNPGLGDLTVDFRGETGAAVRVTGDLDVYGKDQNPALDPEPLATVRIRNSAQTRLTGEDFQRINMVGKAGAATKRAATGRAAPADTPTAFNLVFRSDARTGSLAFGLVYDPAARSFARAGSGLARIAIEPRPLIRYEARLLRVADVHGDVGRVFIPGTPFQASLSDTGFAFEALPPGVFDLRLLGGDGRIFAVQESLDTRAATVFTPDTLPLGHIDTTLNKPVEFSVFTEARTEAFVGMLTTLAGSITGVDPADKRLGILWRVLHDLSPDTAEIPIPHMLKTSATFRKAGVFAMELAVTLGASVARDTLFVTVREAPVLPKSQVLTPLPGETLFVNMPYKITWEADYSGLVSIQLSTQGGKDGWQILADSVASGPGISPFTWTPPATLAGFPSCSIRIMRSRPDSLFVAQMGGIFSISK